MEHNGALWNGTWRSGAEWNIDPTPLFGYFIKNVSFHHIHPKLDGIKNRDLDGMDSIMSISFHPLFTNPNNGISLVTTLFHSIPYHQSKHTVKDNAVSHLSLCHQFCVTAYSSFGCAFYSWFAQIVWFWGFPTFKTIRE